MRWLVFFLIAIFLLTGCAQQAEASQAVESYLQALVTKDRDKFITLICPDFEADAMTEFDSFGAVEAKLENVDCEQTGTQAQYTLVKCKGNISVIYQGENNQVLNLEGNTYQTIVDDGEWRVCGYQ